MAQPPPSYPGPGAYGAPMGYAQYQQPPPQTAPGTAGYGAYAAPQPPTMGGAPNTGAYGAYARPPSTGMGAPPPPAMMQPPSQHPGPPQYYGQPTAAPQTSPPGAMGGYRPPPQPPGASGYPAPPPTGALGGPPSYVLPGGSTLPPPATSATQPMMMGGGGAYPGGIGPSMPPPPTAYGTTTTGPYARPPVMGPPTAKQPTMPPPPPGSSLAPPPSSNLGPPPPSNLPPQQPQGGPYKPAVPFYSTGAQPQPQPGMPPPPGSTGGVQDLSGQFGQMNIRPPPISGAGMPPPPGVPPHMANVPPEALQSPPVYPGTYGGMRSAMSQQMEAAGPPPTPGGPAGLIADGNQLPQLSEVDLSVQCDPRYMRFTVRRIPNSQNNAAATKLPLGVIIQPMALDCKGEENVEVVNFGLTGIVRCKKCRTYINPFVSWLDNGRRWRCNVCGTVNDVPSSYFHHLDQNGQRRDKAQRPELSNGSVELVAPGEYMVRPPQPPVYVFVVDVSYNAVASGMLATAVATIQRSLDELPGEPRTQFGLVTFDSTVHFYNLKSSLKQPQVLVMPDINELFVPLPDDLLVNLKESRAIVDILLESLVSMYSTSRNLENALGPALTAAYRVMGAIGGKMCVLSAALPTVGDGRLKHREGPRVLGTEREHQLLNAEDTWYRTKAIEFSRVQISVDLFLFSAQYTDVATLGTLPKFTGGNLYYYPAFNAEHDGEKFSTELYNLLSRPTGFEAVMRVRVTRGLKITNFFGSYYIRGTDLLALPNCSSESTFAIELAHDETFLTASIICVQTALLHTTSTGERRIRVHTLAAPVSQVIQEVIASVEPDAMCNLIAKRALDVALKTGLDASRARIQQQCADIIRACRGFAATPGMPAQPQGGALPASLELLPLFSLALIKNPCFRGGQDVRPDLRAYLMHLLSIMNVDTSRVFIYPRLFSLHDMPPEVGKPIGDAPVDDDSTGPSLTAGRNQIRLPTQLNLSAERFVSEGVYLLENGLNIWLWVGRRVDPAILSALFGIPSLDNIDPSQLQLRLEDHGSDLSSRVHNIITAMREDRSLKWLQVTVVVEGDPMSAPFYWHLVEDRANFQGGSYNYPEYMQLISRQTYGPGGLTTGG